MPHKPHPEPYHVGDAAPKEGDFVCVPCGFKKHLKPGDRFAECISCLKDEGWHDSYDIQDEEDSMLDATATETEERHLHDEEGAEIAEGMELWEEIQKPEETK